MKALAAPPARADLSASARPSRSKTGPEATALRVDGLGRPAALPPFDDRRSDQLALRELVRLAQHGPRATQQRGQAQALQRRAVQASGLPEPSMLGPLAARRASITPLPQAICSDVARWSGLDLGSVKVHRDSPRPAALAALAYAQGSEIHLGPGQDRHLPHEAWHLVQQAQGRVPMTASLAGVAINDQAALEQEADAMGARIGQAESPVVDAAPATPAYPPGTPGQAVAQRRLPPVWAVNREVHLGGDQASASLHLLRLLHMEHSAGRLLRAADNQPYADADAALADIFPGEVFNTDAYKLLYAANQKYSRILSPNQVLTDESWALLRRGLTRAAFLAFQCSLRPDDIEAVFGPNARVATIAATFRRVSARLGSFGRVNFSMDYHGDDTEMGSGGSTTPNSGRIQVSPVMLGKPADVVAVLLMHEGCHEVDATIIDKGYYGTAGFDTLSAPAKMTNAAHYEEIARRVNGNSQYPDQVFAPVAPQAVRVGRRPELLRKVGIANDGLREMWLLAANMHDLLRHLANDTSTLPALQQAPVLATIKQAFSLTATPPRGKKVTELDLALSEAHVKVLSRAQTKLGHFKREPAGAGRDLLVAMSPRGLALEAVARAGGFQNVDPDFNLTALQQIRTAAILLDAPDPFPQLDEEAVD